MGTRSALLGAAVAAIVEEGWQAAGSRSVASRAGAPLGALNYHFGSKEALFRAAAMAEVGAMFATPWRIIADSREIGELVEGMLGWSRSPDVTPVQQVLLLEVMAQSRRDPELATALRAGLDGYRHALAGALHRLGAVPPGPGAEPTEEALELAGAFAAQCNGLWLQFVIEPGLPHAAAAARAAETWRRALNS